MRGLVRCWTDAGHESRMTGSCLSACRAECTGDEAMESMVLWLRIECGTESVRACHGTLVTSRGIINSGSMASSSSSSGADCAGGVCGRSGLCLLKARPREGDGVAGDSCCKARGLMSGACSLWGAN